MKKNQEMAQSILALAGGPSNVKEALHCMTRLRIKMKDKSLVDLDGIKGVKGVLGAQFAEDALQVIIGPSVDEVYREFIAISGLSAQAMIDENLDSELQKKKITPKQIANNILNTFASCMTPLIPLFVALGMVNVIAALIGPSFFNLVSEKSDLYTNFYNIGQSIIYFLPVFVAITASKQFKCSTMIAVALAGLMLYPEMINALSAEGGYTVYGIPAPNVAYNAQIIPILLVVFVQSYVEKFFRKIIPNAIRVFGIPLATLIVMLPLTFCALGPAGYYIGSAMSSAVHWLYSVAGPIETMIFGALGAFLLAFGISRPIFFASLSVFMTEGVEFAFMPIAMVLTNWVTMGIALGYIIKSKSADKKQVGVTSLAANALGGVSEPILFGIIIPEKKTYLPVIISGALSGLFVGIMKVGYYQFGPSNFLNVLGFIGGEGNNFIYGCIASAIAFISAFVLMLVLYRENSSANKELTNN